MTGWERLKRLLEELVWIIGPKYEGDYGWIFFIGFFLLAFICRKEFGGFLSAIWSLFWLVVFLYVLQCVHPALMWGFLGISVALMISGKYRSKIMKILRFLIAGAIIFAIYSYMRGA